MRDKRPVDELSIEELERILAIKKREARQTQLNRMQRSGRVVAASTAPTGTPPPVSAPTQRPALPETLTPAANGHALTKAQPTAPVLTPAGDVVEVSQITPRFEDDPDEAVMDAVTGGYREQKKRQDAVWRRFVNGTLLLVEVAAVFGLIYISVSLLTARDTLREETNAVQISAEATRQAGIPTIAPTPTLRIENIVLPGGHIFENGQPIINTTEIPAHLLPAVQTQLLRPLIERPPQTNRTPLTLTIDKIGVDNTIVQGTDWEALQAGIGQALNGATPYDDNGNVVLAAHNDIFGSIFRDLDDLVAGDRFTIRTENGIHTYEVTHWEVVEPDAVHVMENKGRPMATLISCYPYGVNSHRIVVFANRVDSTQL
ncbi:MAG: hypothetical protein OHK0046_10820 [Anaerolineae bacterium]